MAPWLTLALPVLIFACSLPVSLAVISKRCLPEFCYEGQFKDIAKGSCEPCPDGQFMPDPVHCQVECYTCQNARAELAETVLAECTSTRDTILGCTKGHFLNIASRFNPEVIKCLPCTDCDKTEPASYKIRPCGESVDTLCCSEWDMVGKPVEGRQDYTCHFQNSSSKTLSKRQMCPPTNDHPGTERPTMFGPSYDHYKAGLRLSLTDGVKPKCSKGQYMETNEDTGQTSCKPCPDGTFMPEERHANQYCVTCATYKKNPIDIMACKSKTEAPFLAGCTQGNHLITLSMYGDTKQCAPCKRCEHDEFEARPCSNHSDSLCCPKSQEGTESSECKRLKQTTTTTTSTTTTPAVITDGRLGTTSGADVDTTSRGPTTGRRGDRSSAAKAGCPPGCSADDKENKYIVAICFLVIFVIISVISITINVVLYRLNGQREGNSCVDNQVDLNLNQDNRPHETVSMLYIDGAHDTAQQQIHVCTNGEALNDY